MSHEWHSLRTHVHVRRQQQAPPTALVLHHTRCQHEVRGNVTSTTKQRAKGAKHGGQGGKGHAMVPGAADRPGGPLPGLDMASLASLAAALAAEGTSCAVTGGFGYEPLCFRGPPTTL